MVSLNKINTANLYLNTGKLKLITVNLNIDWKKEKTERDYCYERADM